MRVIAGQARGMRLAGPPARKGCTPPPDIRPTSDRVREALFNILGDAVQGVSVLDAFAGCGTLGIEALSRGAARCVFVENDRRAAAVLRQNIEHTRMADHAHIVTADTLRSVERLRALDVRFGLLMFDPPYRLLANENGWRALGEFLVALAEAGRVAAKALVVIEHRAGDAPEAPPVRLREIDRRTWGDTGVVLLAFAPDEGT